MDTTELDDWLGRKYETNLPLQRSLSLDGGLEMISQLKRDESEYIASDASTWTLQSDDERYMEQCRSFEDIPASPVAKSRRGSSERGSLISSLVLSGSSRHLVKLQRYFSYKEEKAEAPEGAKEHFYRSISIDRINWDSMKHIASGSSEAKPVLRHSQSQKKLDLRRQVLQRVRTTSCSCGNIPQKVAGQQSRRPSAEMETIELPKLGYSQHRQSNSCVDVDSLKRNIYKGDQSTVPVVVDESVDTPVAKNDVSSNFVECDCQMCSNPVEEKSVFSIVYSKLFMSITSYRTYGRKWCFTDDGELTDGEMYACVLNVLKLVLGIWLRHLDHK